MTKSKYLAIVIVLSVVLLGEIAVAVFMFSVPSQPLVKNDVNQSLVININLNTNQAPAPLINVTPVNTNQPVPEKKDCGTDWKCFELAASHCNPATITDIFPMNGFFGMDVSTKTFYEVKGKDQSDCVLYQKVLEQTVAFSEVAKQKLLAKGATAADLDKQLAEANAMVQQSIIGVDGQCWFDSIGNLVLYLTKIDQGNLKGSIRCSGGICTGSGDLINLSKRCTGKMFENSITPAVNQPSN